MVKLLKKLRPEILKLIEDISRLANKTSYNVCLVGGFVRDILLKRENLDLDIMVEGSGIDFASRLARKLKAKIITHKRFGTATLTCGNGIKIDIATARKEMYLKPAELPKVSLGAIEDDLKRRDFSINALAVSLNKHSFGRIIDLFNGQGDIKKGYIRILHDNSFIDDPTRILRGIRFEQRFGFKFAASTKALIVQAKKLKMLKEVQKHRLRDELVLILKENNPPRVISRTKALYGLTFIHKKIKFDKTTQRLFKDIQKQIIWFKNNFPRKRHLDEWLIYLIILLRRLKQKELIDFCHKFAFKRGETKRILSYNKELKHIGKLLNKDKTKPSRIYQSLEHISYEVIIAVLVTLKNKKIARHIHDFFSIYNGTKLMITGHDLKDLGIRPGPHFKEVLHKVLCAKLDNKLSQKREELSFLKQQLGMKGK